MQRFLLIFFWTLQGHVGLASASEPSYLDGWSVYFFGYVRHRIVTPETNDGDMEYVGLSKSLYRGNWQFENGFSTYVDSFHLRSYSAFIDISHRQWSWKMVATRVKFIFFL